MKTLKSKLIEKITLVVISSSFDCKVLNIITFSDFPMLCPNIDFIIVQVLSNIVDLLGT